MTTEGKFFWIVYTCQERYSENLMNELVGGILTTEERVNEVLELVEQNPTEEVLIKELRKIRERDKI